MPARSARSPRGKVGTRASDAASAPTSMKPTSFKNPDGARPPRSTNHMRNAPPIASSANTTARTIGSEASAISVASLAKKAGAARRSGGAIDREVKELPTAAPFEDLVETVPVLRLGLVTFERLLLAFLVLADVDRVRWGHREDGEVRRER